jgi:sugar O-acyltransferase (sialic acid O-acetyltransferase NeuD family)
MRPLLLVAAGGLAREVIEALRAGYGARDLRLVDDDPSLHGTSLLGVPVVGGLDLVGVLEDHDVVVCAGRGATRQVVVDRLLGLGVAPSRFATVVHPSVHVPPSCSVGRGSVLLAGVVLTADVWVGAHVVAMPHVTLTHDVVVEDYATLCAGVSLGGGVRVGPAAYLGMNSSVRQGVTIGPGATLGMGAVLLRDLAAGDTGIGVPATSTATATEREAG